MGGSSSRPPSVASNHLSEPILNSGEDEAEIRESSNRLQDQPDYRDGREWVADLADEYDYCMVFPPGGEYMDHYIPNLAGFGLEMFCYKEKFGKGNLFVLIRAPVKVLRTYADQNNFMLLMDEQLLERTAHQGFPPQIAPIEIAHDPSVIRYRPYEFIYCKYSQRIDENIYYREPGDAHPFARDVIRLKILALLMESRPHQGGENLKLKRYLRYGRILGIFPLHDSVKKKALQHAWLRKWLPWRMPFLRIKEYMGEKVGLYYVFAGHYNRFLLIPAIVGVPIQIAVFYYDGKAFNYDGMNDAPFLPFYSFFVSLWAIFMLEFWKRRERRTALEWGTSGQEAHDVPQPEFRGERMRSFIDGSENYLHFPTSTRNTYTAQSALAIVGLTLLVIGLVASLYYLKDYIETQGVPPSDAQTLASTINSIQIQIANWGYTFLATELTNRENHRTQARYDDALVVKIFVFQFINRFVNICLLLVAC